MEHHQKNVELGIAAPGLIMLANTLHTVLEESLVPRGMVLRALNISATLGLQAQQELSSIVLAIGTALPGMEACATTGTALPGLTALLQLITAVKAATAARLGMVPTATNGTATNGSLILLMTRTSIVMDSGTALPGMELNAACGTAALGPFLLTI